MQAGPNGNNLASEAAERHPVQRIQQQGVDLNFVRHVYGSGLAMRLATEQKLAQEQVTAPGMPSSGLYGDIVSGRDTKLDFGDFLSLPQHCPDFNKELPHVAMERQLGM